MPQHVVIIQAASTIGGGQINKRERELGGKRDHITRNVIIACFYLAYFIYNLPVLACTYSCIGASCYIFVFTFATQSMIGMHLLKVTLVGNEIPPNKAFLVEHPSM